MADIDNTTWGDLFPLGSGNSRDRRTRDADRGKAYAAENRFWSDQPKEVWARQRVTEAGDVAEARRAVRRIYKVIGKRFAPHVEMIRGRSSWATESHLRLSKTLPNWILLHEIAHSLTPADHGHGLPWRQCYVGLVEKLCGKQTARGLAQAFRQGGLRMATRPGRRLSPEQREASIARLANARKERDERYQRALGQAELIERSARKDWTRWQWYDRCDGCNRWIGSHRAGDLWTTRGEGWTDPDWIQERTDDSILCCSQRCVARAVVRQERKKK